MGSSQFSQWLKYLGAFYGFFGSVFQRISLGWDDGGSLSVSCSLQNPCSIQKIFGSLPNIYPSVGASKEYFFWGFLQFPSSQDHPNFLPPALGSSLFPKTPIPPFHVIFPIPVPDPFPSHSQYPTFPLPNLQMGFGPFPTSRIPLFYSLPTLSLLRSSCSPWICSSLAGNDRNNELFPNLADLEHPGNWECQPRMWNGDQEEQEMQPGFHRLIPKGSSQRSAGNRSRTGNP